MKKTLGRLLDESAAALVNAGFAEPRRQARRLIAAALDLSPAEQLTHGERLVGNDEEGRLRAMFARMAAGEPLSRIAGRRAFWGLEFALSADTLDPRPESETVVEAVLRRLPDRNTTLRFLDLGTGTGCLLLALLSEYPAGCGIGVDVAPGAAACARGNAAKLGLGGRAGFFVGDWGSALSGRFDAILANPPYVESAALAGLPPEVARWDPRRALDGGVDGLSPYRAIAADLPRLLKPQGFFAGEIGLGQADAVAAIVAAAGLRVEGIERDLAGIARCIVARATPSSGEA